MKTRRREDEKMRRREDEKTKKNGVQERKWIKMGVMRVMGTMGRMGAMRVTGRMEKETDKNDSI